LFNTIDNAIKQVFGKPTSETIRGFLKRHILFEQEKITIKIEVFYSYLEKLLGPEGAQLIQTTSLKNLCLKLEREYKKVEMFSRRETSSMRLSSGFYLPP